MCQLLGMNCNTPTDIGFSFAGFRQRGGATDHHEDGFGIAFFERNPNGKIGLRQFHDDKPSHLSPVADLVNHYPIKAMNVIAHIRKATTGENSLANTHPFVREVWGEQWAFAHNGQMTDSFIRRTERLIANGNAEHYAPVGDTDSELAFCYLLNRLKATFKTRPSDEALFAFLTAQCRYLSANGLFNCLISNGNWQLAYAGSLLFYLTRQAPFGEAKLSDGEMSVNFKDVTTDKDKVTVLVTIPLTDNETWQQLAVDECVIFQDGDVVFKDTPSKKTYLSIEEGIALARSVGASV
ncbi:class II glutamine amidotransferase [Moraxella caviae]|uniref:Amidophosphoribosyltransferase n=1 Tax=Moraxella caviae TaxID=34060 RepID=A0A1T0A1I2_9GAMM|nr:class II glutamine amidotransferase [Moraxella caviae]OOR89603.1 class II glutamine amidotransferase [Moraxella caviae]STZ10287.1 amidophosphoribosyltransferase [Moraxella caviae]